ncbi:cytochrome C [Geomonas paludis]|uniref:Cytochrome C n=1 Tax=Geomonas paludis TaxID=2740185 RepID=A0A6V8MXB8_9BACT|nr:cytochrome C [Geomonas paludis]UPU37141.1 cytochrome C [Geomonas paludis]GFO64762.1 cytochrome c [Geomonas paludis]
MSKRFQKKAPLVAAVAVIGVAAGSAFAATHDNIVLRDRNKVAIKSTDTKNAFSMQGTCGYCHNGTATNDAGQANGKTLLSYNEIERHNYHASLGQNEFRGFNPYNPDSTDAWRVGAAAPGKSWVQSPGHVGSW